MAKKRQGSKSSSKARNPRDTEFDVTFEEVKDDHYLDIRTLSNFIYSLAIILELDAN